ncbi:hypothetical protein [Planctomicrobium sp. SH664]|uniref:hypothetical protein n=1 Tax=Planctomicrobium sp. SH664 TaxID=3448125 RepID=UPI003F5B4CE1
MLYCIYYILGMLISVGMWFLSSRRAGIMNKCQLLTVRACLMVSFACYAILLLVILDGHKQLGVIGRFFGVGQDRRGAAFVVSLLVAAKAGLFTSFFVFIYALIAVRDRGSGQ